MVKVIIIQRLFAIYRKPIFDLLNKKVSLRLLSGASKNGIAVISSPYSYSIKQITYYKNETNRFLFSFFPVIKFRPHVIIHEFAIGIASLPLMLFIAKIIQSKFILYSHGYNRKLGFNPKKSLLDKYRLWLMNKANAIILYGEMDKLLLSNYVNPEKLFVAQNTIDTYSLTKYRDIFELEGKSSIRKRLKWKEGYHLTFIGRLLKEKHPEVLLEVLNLSKKFTRINTFIHFIGGGSYTNFLKNKAKELGVEEYVYFYGEMYDNIETGEILYSSDLMVMPGYLGLSVNHAFCFDCPVISFLQTSNGPFHSPEIEYVIDGKTGFLVKEQSVEALTQSIYNYLTDFELQKEMKGNIRDMVNFGFPPEKMVKGILDAIEFSLK
jgi:glycosyltransferase involved in cell wall biosynthesis